MADSRADTKQIDHDGTPLVTVLDTLTGGALGRVRYAWQTPINSVDPGTGNIRYNHGTIGSVTSLIISQTDKAALDQAGWFGTFDDSSSTVKGQITITNDFGGAALSNVFNITGAPTDQGTWWTIPVTYASGSLPAAGNTSVVISFARTGDRGLETLAAGSAAAPSLAPTGDSNTGFWFPAADTIAASTAGVERLRVLSDGKVGIGTTTPNAPLQVANYINFEPTSVGTFIGYQAGNSVNTATTYNTFLGYRAGYVITDGIRNTAVGYSALFSNVTGDYNVAVGYSALSDNTNTTGHNTAIGSRALDTDVSGSYNVALGAYAMYLTAAAGIGSVAIGYTSLGANTANYNTAVGHSSFADNTSALGNVGLGAFAGSTVTGAYNTMIGAYAGRYHLTGTENTMVGYTAGASTGTTTCRANTFVGYQAGKGAITGADYNTCVGNNSGFGITTGAKNVLFGQCTTSTSYDQVTTGSRNVSIGNDVAVPSATANDQLCISNFIYGTSMTGTGSTVSTSGQLGFGTKTPGAQVDISHTGGGVLRLSRNDTGLTVDEVLGKIEFHTNDTDDTSVRATISALKDDGASSRAPTALVFSTGNATAAELSEKFRITSDGVLRAKTFTVATLPTSVAGARAFVTDASGPTFGAAVVGGGAVGVPVYHDGASWKVG